MTFHGIRTALLCWVGLIATQAVAVTPQQVDNLTRTWLELEQQSRQLRADWAEQQPILEQRLSLLQEEKAQLQAMVASHQSREDEVEQKRSQLLAEQQQLETAQHGMVQQLEKLQLLLVQLQPLLPPQLQQRWQQEAAASSPEYSIQLQVALAQLAAVRDFNQQITVAESELPAADGQSVLVHALLVGSGYGWFVSQEGRYRGYGRVVAGQWQWQFDDRLDGDLILEALAQVNKQQEPGLIELPVMLTQQENRP